MYYSMTLVIHLKSITNNSNITLSNTTTNKKVSSFIFIILQKIKNYLNNTNTVNIINNINSRI